MISPEDITILYEDEILLVVDKPRDIHVHPTKLSRGETSLQDLLEDRLGRRPYPAHRLDRPVGGVMLLAKDPDTAGTLGLMVRERDALEKRYVALVRGRMEGRGKVDRPLNQAPGKPRREALTHWQVLETGEAPWSDGRNPRSRYSLVECRIETGRYHQIRRHLAFLSHPVMGDTAHGDGTKNKIWLRETGLDGLLLRSVELAFRHPEDGRRLRFSAPLDPRFHRIFRLFGWKSIKEGD